jgi:hypothetical protein
MKNNYSVQIAWKLYHLIETLNEWLWDRYENTFLEKYLKEESEKYWHYNLQKTLEEKEQKLWEAQMEKELQGDLEK